jgi:hypothetical protein
VGDDEAATAFGQPQNELPPEVRLLPHEHRERATAGDQPGETGPSGAAVERLELWEGLTELIRPRQPRLDVIDGEAHGDGGLDASSEWTRHDAVGRPERRPDAPRVGHAPRGEVLARPLSLAVTTHFELAHRLSRSLA